MAYKPIHDLIDGAIQMDEQTATELAISNILHDGLTDVFEQPFEVAFLNDSSFREAVAKNVVRALKAHSIEGLEVGPIQHCLHPKSRRVYDFRRCALIQPIDAIKYLALVIMCAEKLERARVPVEQKIIYSYRFQHEPTGRIWSAAFNFETFRQHTLVLQQSEGVRVVVQCDIANFYDRINLHRLESTLISVGIEPWITKCLNFLLLGWAHRDSYGLPVGSNPSRILAEAALLEVDRYLLANGVRFCRFVDDYRFFAPDATTAQSWLCKFLGRLALEGLSLNAGKTRVREAHAPEDEISPGMPAPVIGEKKVFVPRMGYGRVPRRFRDLKEEEIARLRSEVSLDELYREIEERAVVEGERFELFVRTLVAQEAFGMMAKIPGIVRRCPPYIDYIVSLFGKCADAIPEETRRSVSQDLGELLISLELPEWYSAQIASLLSRPQFQNQQVIRTCLQNLRRDVCSSI